MDLESGNPLFLVEREKSAPGSDFSEKVIDAAKLVAKSLEGACSRKLSEMLADGTIEEICLD